MNAIHHRNTGSDNVMDGAKKIKGSKRGCRFNWELKQFTRIRAQNKEGILPVATLSIALYVLRRSMSASDVAPEVTILSSAL